MENYFTLGSGINHGSMNKNIMIQAKWRYSLQTLILHSGKAVGVSTPKRKERKIMKLTITTKCSKFMDEEANTCRFPWCRTVLFSAAGLTMDG
jgi:hypothetical protein